MQFQRYIVKALRLNRIQNFSCLCINMLLDARYILRLVISRLLPNHVTRPYPRSSLEEIRQNDSKRNAESSPPPNEYIDLYSIWAIEFYTPAHKDRLLESIEHLGWSSDGSRDPVRWIREQGASQFGQACMYLGRILPHSDPDPQLIPTFRAQLPQNVKYAYGEIYCFTPSLFAMVFEFVFDKGYSRVFDNALRQNRETYATPDETGFLIHDPSEQKGTHIKEIRREATRLVTDWFSSNIPGLCSVGLLGGEWPTCEFVTLSKLKPFPSTKERNVASESYLWNLGLSNSYGTWESADMPELRLKPPLREHNIPPYHCILSVHEGSWIKQEEKEMNETDRESRIYGMHSRMSGIVSIWSIEVLLQGYARHFRDLRNSTFWRSKQYSSVIQSLEKIGESVSYSVDIAAVTSELSSYVQNKRILGFEIESFVRRADAPESWGKDNLQQLIQRQIGENAKWLVSMENALRNQITQFGTILGMTENMRSQMRITLLTRLMLALTIVLAVLTFFTLLDNS